MADLVLELKGICRSYRQGSLAVDALQNVSFSLKKGQLCALVGPSGSGKSTLLQIAGLLDAPTSGELSISGQNASRISEAERTALRSQHIGFVYQFHHLLPEFTALENVMLPQRIIGTNQTQAQANAAELLQQVGLADRMHHRPAELSGGQQQRVAIARALANQPALLLADEPTGNLDAENSQHIVESLLKLAKEHGTAALIATHQEGLAKQMDSILHLQDGQLSIQK